MSIRYGGEDSTDKRMVCDHCGYVGELLLESEDARAWAKRQRWVIVPGVGDYCHCRCALGAGEKVGGASLNAEQAIREIAGVCTGDDAENALAQIQGIIRRVGVGKVSDFVGTAGKHTPGPWIIDECGYDSLENMAENILAGDWVAVGMTNKGEYCESVAYCHPNNAPLIAAAPELLSAIQQCLPIINKFRKLTGGEGDGIAMNARAAIAKAEGRE